MSEIKFKDVAQFLMIGREIEFAYHEKNYSITNQSGHWYLCCDSDHIILERLCKFEESALLVSKIKYFQIESIMISEIFDALEYDTASVFIL